MISMGTITIEYDGVDIESYKGRTIQYVTISVKDAKGVSRDDFNSTFSYSNISFSAAKARYNSKLISIAYLYRTRYETPSTLFNVQFIGL